MTRVTGDNSLLNEKFISNLNLPVSKTISHHHLPHIPDMLFYHVWSCILSVYAVTHSTV